jgi:hypothetical protein
MRFKQYIYLIFLTLTLSCQNPLENFTLTFKIPIAEGLFSFLAYDYLSNIPTNINLDVIGPDKQKIVNILGDPKIIQSEDGKFTLAIPENINVSKSSPFKFNCRIGGNIYTSKYFNIEAIGKNNLIFSFRIASKKTTQNGAIGDSLLVDSKPLIWEKRNEKDQIVTRLIFQKETTWKNSQSTNFELNVVQFNRNGRGFVPGGGRIIKPYNTENISTENSLEVKDFAGMVYIQVIDQNWEIKSESVKPFLLEIALLENSNNTNNLPWKIGDSLEVFNLDETNNQWYLNKKVPVFKKDGSWWVNKSIYKSGYWIFGGSRKICNEGPIFTFNTTYTDLDIAYYYRVLNSENKIIRTGYVSLNNGSTLNLNYFGDDTGNIKLQIFDYSDFRQGNLEKAIFTSNQKDACSVNKETINIKLNPAPNPVEVELKLQCPNGTSISPSLLKTQIKTQISIPEKNQWRDLLTFTFENPKIKTYKLQKGNVYDFRISTDGGNTWPYKQNNYKIKEQTWSLDVNADGYCK